MRPHGNHKGQIAMKCYERILVCIGKPERDVGMLDYLGTICRAAATKEIHLLYVESDEAAVPLYLEDLGLPPAAALEPAKPSGMTLELLHTLATEHFRGHGQEKIICQVVTGTPLLEILRYGMEHDIDLIVIGRRAGGGLDVAHEATLARRVTRKATCSVLVLPEQAQYKADKILVPVRDSECSANAMEMACLLATSNHGTVCCLNVFHVGSGYASIGSTLEEHTAILNTWAERQCQELLRRVNTNGATVITKCVPDLYGKPVAIILQEIENESADFVVIGARGRTGAAGVLLGNVTEQLIRQSTVPLLAVKKKGECIGVLRALLTLAE